MVGTIDTSLIEDKPTVAPKMTQKAKNVTEGTEYSNSTNNILKMMFSS